MKLLLLLLAGKANIIVLNKIFNLYFIDVYIFSHTGTSSE